MDKSNGNPIKRKSKRKFIGTRDVIDHATGEVLATHGLYKNYAPKAKYATMYLDDENVYVFLQGLGNNGKIWAYILKSYNDKTGLFYFTASTKEAMIEELELSIGTIRSAVKDFNDSGMLVRVIGSEYLVNPRVFYKGPQEHKQVILDLYEKLAAAKRISETQKSIDKKTVK